MVEGARLESVYTGNRIAGSNPAPSATTHNFEDSRSDAQQFSAIRLSPNEPEEKLIFTKHLVLLRRRLSLNQNSN